jgi:hypothetical protein
MPGPFLGPLDGWLDLFGIIVLIKIIEVGFTVLLKFSMRKALPAAASSAFPNETFLFNHRPCQRRRINSGVVCLGADLKIAFTSQSSLGR